MEISHTCLTEVAPRHTFRLSCLSFPMFGHGSDSHYDRTLSIGPIPMAFEIVLLWLVLYCLSK